MQLPSSLRSFVPLAIGLIVGGVGAVFFQQSLPGAEGSPQQRADKLELELKQAKNRIIQLEGITRHKSTRTLADGARTILDDIREGRAVSPDDIFRASQPLMRDLSPLIDRMRVRNQQREIDRMTGELARKYDLNPAQQASLKEWFSKKAEDDAQYFSKLVAQDGTRLEDLMDATSQSRSDQGVDAVMESMLTGDKLSQFKKDRQTERAQRVEDYADLRMQRIDGIVQFDDQQRDEVFGIMARSSKDYDPTMTIGEKSGVPATTDKAATRAAVLAVMRPEQRATFEKEMQRRQIEAAKDMEAIGMKLPDGWDAYQENLFR